MKPTTIAISVRLNDDLLKKITADKLFELLSMKARVESRSVNHMVQLILEDYFKKGKK